MDEEHPALRQDPLFHDAWTGGAAQGDDFALARRDPPAGWERVASDGWIAYIPDGVAVPAQGWIVHVSACLDNAEAVLGSTFDYCMERKIPFKFFRSLNALLIRNSTYMDRGSSGEFVTVCPADDRHLEIVLHELGAILEGQAGPDIVRDLRWGGGPLHVRYGAFNERWCVGPSGELELAITDGDGQLVPDRRGSLFELPDWVPLPAFLSPYLQARTATEVADIPYVIEIALHFSNGGGLYQARDKLTGEAVVLKEASTNPGLGQDTEEAFARLRREHDVLTELAGLDAIPAVRGWFTAGDRQFLAEEFVDGASLQDLFIERYPLAKNDPDDAMLATYTAWVLDVQEQLEAAVAGINERGVVLGNLHPGNVFVREDGSLVLIDFEAAFRVEAVPMSSPDDAVLRPAAGRRGFAMDEHALASFRLFWFLPLTDLIPLTAGKASELAAEIAKVFPVPGEFLARAVSVIAGVAGGPGRAPARLEPDPEGWESTRDSIARAILASATPERVDRLFPGDGQPFDASFTGGLNLAHGAAGVLLALDLTGGRRHRSHEKWLVARATAPVGDARLGFYDGLHGVAYALEALGRSRDALDVLDRCTAGLRRNLDAQLETASLDLYGGLAGIGLNLDHFAEVTGDAQLAGLAARVTQAVADRLGDEEGAAARGDHRRTGLLRGSSGPALLFIRRYERTGEAWLLDLAAAALRQDLRRCVLRAGGCLEVDRGWRTAPCLGDGSAGIGLVVDDYLAYRSDCDLADAAVGIRTAATTTSAMQPGLFNGRAGMILHLSRSLARRLHGSMTPHPLVQDQLARLARHGLSSQAEPAPGGDHRRSMDLATGAAGVLLGLGAALHDGPVGLPFLGPLLFSGVHDAVHVTRADSRYPSTGRR